MRTFMLLTAMVVIAGVAPGLAAAQDKTDQQIAESIVADLKTSGQLKGYSIAVKYKEGSVQLDGWVRDSEQMAKAVEIVNQTGKASRIVNNLSIQGTQGSIETAVRQTSVAETKKEPSPRRFSFFAGPKEAPSQPQPKQQQVVAAPRSGAMMKLRHGTSSASQAPAASPIPTQVAATPASTRAERVPAAAGASNATVRAAYPQVQPDVLPSLDEEIPQTVEVPNALAPAAPTPTVVTPGYPPHMMAPNAPLPAYMQGGPAPSAYDQPQLPNYAWPSYASYPNYAALTYPKQYSPTAWPYIGPFYPYPQVPLGWRKVTLEWDDGWWFVDFSDKRDHCR